MAEPARRRSRQSKWGVQHRGEADLDAEALGIGRNRRQRLGTGLHQQAIDDGLVVIGNGRDLWRQREHDVEVRHIQQLGLACLQPRARLRSLTPRTMPVAAATIANGGVTARRVGAARDVAAEVRRPAALDRAHYLELVVTEVALHGLTPSGAVIAEDVRDLQGWPGHGEPPITSASSSSVPTDRADRAGSPSRATPCSPRAHSVRSCRAWNVPEPPGSDEYRHPAPACAWRMNA
jgi:hypothetical protein